VNLMMGTFIQPNSPERAPERKPALLGQHSVSLIRPLLDGMLGAPLQFQTFEQKSPGLPVLDVQRLDAG
jgi:hypothetical protein